MQSEQIKQLISNGLKDAQVQVTGDGRHFEAVVISSQFAELNLLERQRKVYSTLGEHIRNGDIHALSIKAKTPDEWQQENKG